MYVLYTILSVLIGCCLLPGLLWRCTQGTGYHRDFLERFGAGTAWRLAFLHARGGLWFHAASVGEVQGVAPIIARLQQSFPTLPVICSTFTPSGKTMAQRLLPDADSIVLLPFDFPWIMGRVMKRLKPRVVIVQETELWPYWFRCASRQDIPVVVVNGRLSPRSTRLYGWIRALMRHLLADVTLLLVQSAEIGQRFQRLGAVSCRVKIVGNTNVDRALIAAEQEVPRREWAPIMHGRRVWVAGSTHEGEEHIILDVYRRLQLDYPDLLLVLAPRHMERVETVIRHVRAVHLEPVRRSALTHTEPVELFKKSVLILDTLGELASLYTMSTIAFVGGSLVPIGGHNILEPVVFAKPVLFGPYLHNFPELAQMLRAANGAVQVQDGEGLYQQLNHLLQHPHEAVAMGQRGFETLRANRGALTMTCDLVARVIAIPTRAVGLE